MNSTVIEKANLVYKKEKRRKSLSAWAAYPCSFLTLQEHLNSKDVKYFRNNNNFIEWDSSWLQALMTPNNQLKVKVIYWLAENSKGIWGTVGIEDLLLRRLIANGKKYVCVSPLKFQLNIKSHLTNKKTLC